jgi:hypothetical protein
MCLSKNVVVQKVTPSIGGGSPCFSSRVISKIAACSTLRCYISLSRGVTAAIKKESQGGLPINMGCLRRLLCFKE